MTDEAEAPALLNSSALSRPLTSDTPLLSEVTKPENKADFCAINCTTILPDDVLGLVRDSLAANAPRGYRFDIAAFESWGGTIPASPTMVATHIAAEAGSLSMSTLVRRLSAISKAHEAKGLPNPVKTELVRATMRGAKRKFGRPAREARPLLRDDLILTLSRMGDEIRDARDRALLLVGFAGAFRRSELCAINCNDLDMRRNGLIVHIPRSKTDQTGEGRKVGIPFGRTRWCPIEALRAWLSLAEINDGPIFRPIDRHKNIAPSRLSGDAVSVIVKERVAAAGLDPAGYSGHSLRAGLATSAAQAGVPTWKIRAQTGHASDAMLARYVRGGEVFVGNAAVALL